ncbi:MAG TPA: hypothetical protein PLE19_20880 [Planctomycetota bacterium]|jgi:hypothetical protein|nr:hypothetical protein [Planctomycetota bacterium]
MSECAGQYERVPACPADRCKGEFSAIHTKLDRLDEAIRGNSKPGIQLRLDRLEAAEAVRSKLLWIIAGSTVTLALGAVWKIIFGA